MSVQKNVSRPNRGLGRGIGALIPTTKIQTSSNYKTTTQPGKGYFMCDIERIIPNQYQPREIFDSKALGELSKSIKENGIIQPLIVRKNGNSFELIAGERRWKASMIAGLKRVPVVIREVTERQSLEMAIIENIQRDDLTCIEEAKSYKHLMTDFMMTQDQVALKVGKDRATVANMVRLLLLPEIIQLDLAEKTMSMGHARALLAVQSEKKQLELRHRILKESLSVRDVENIVKKIKEGDDKIKKIKPNTDFTYLIEELKKSLQTKIDVKGKRDKGKIIIHYSNEHELDRIFNQLVE